MFTTVYIVLGLAAIAAAETSAKKPEKRGVTSGQTLAAFHSPHSSVQTVHVPVPHPVPVPIPHPVPVSVPRPFPVTVQRTVGLPVPVGVPVPVHIPVPKPYPVPVPVNIPQSSSVGHNPWASASDNPWAGAVQGSQGFSGGLFGSQGLSGSQSFPGGFPSPSFGLSSSPLSQLGGRFGYGLGVYSNPGVASLPSAYSSGYSPSFSSLQQSPLLLSGGGLPPGLTSQQLPDPSTFSAASSLASKYQ